MSPQLWHGNLMKLILTVGLLSLLAVSEIKAQTDHSLTPAHAERVCKHTHQRMHQSECQPCMFTGGPCRPGMIFVRLHQCPNIGDGVKLCRVTCKEELTTENCCLGFWGDNCTEECPGGSLNPCNGHRKCSRKTGQCVCEAGFRGTACELCTNVTKSWPNCSLEDVMSASTEAGMTTPAQVERFCKQTYRRTYQTECQPCSYKRHPCHPGGVFVGLKFCSEKGTCLFVCEEEYKPEYCCHGFWGDGCIQECPGGSTNPCNGHGECSRKCGQCDCEPGFGGRACELCTNVTKYWPNCSPVETEFCPYIGYGFKTCRVSCEEDYTEECCLGFWGDGCTKECPGGTRNPCNGHGKCSSKNGQCVCEPGFGGTACERCTKVSKHWPNCSLQAGMTTPAQGERFCKQTYKRTHQSECRPCSYRGSPCEAGSVYAGLTFCSDRSTCRFVCQEEYTPEYCCHGFWGNGCIQECPGGSGNPCNGHGECSRKNGQCVCEPGFGGTACELCTNVTKYGPDCSLDCKCEDGECSNGIHGDGLCTQGNPCRSPVSPCGKNKQCIHTGPDKYTCICHDGYAGDGTECAPINPCQNNNGGCHVTTDCVYTGPNQHKCQCKVNYEGDPGKGCTVKNMGLPSDCAPNAAWMGIAPYTYSCSCDGGYTWVGKVCKRNTATAQCKKEGERNCTCPAFMVLDGITCRRRTIAEQIMELPQVARLSRIMKMVNASNNILDVVNSSYTFFAPDNRAIMKKFKKNKKSLEYWSREENALSFLKFHTIKHSFSTDDLMPSDGVVRSYPTLYDGYSLHIENIKQNVYIYSSHSKPAVIRNAHIPVVNGYINIINQVLVPFIPDSQEPSVKTLLSSKPKYRLFYEALQKTNDLETLSSLKEYTLFVFPNEVVQNMKRDITADFLKFHILPQRVSTNAMLDETVKDTILGPRYTLSMKRLHRKIYVNDVKITRKNMWTDKGVVHEVDEFLRPVNNRCNLKIRKHVMQKECCGGYFGIYCDKCPGGPEVPCSGHGVCDDGFTGSGKCKCNPGFSGELCESCERADLVPPDCDICE